MSGYGIPYMGSKASIVPSIAMNFPPADHFYELFGGGFSISHYMLEKKSKNYKYFHYNKFKPQWISREDFFKYKDTDAFIRCLWSFGNNQKDYLFGEDIEEYKRSIHIAVVFNQCNDIAFSVFGFKEWPKNVNTITKKRFYLRQKTEWLRVKNKIPKQLYPYLPKRESNNLRQLERLQQLQQLERLTITALDYRAVEILPNSIVYCDIPYHGTAEYGEFNHKEFFDWAATREFPVYISEYNISDKRFQLVYSINKRALLSSKKGNKQMDEKLYWNRVKL